jgi:hypothetical protein
MLDLLKGEEMYLIKTKGKWFKRRVKHIIRKIKKSQLPWKDYFLISLKASEAMGPIEETYLTKLSLAVGVPKEYLQIPPLGSAEQIRIILNK